MRNHIITQKVIKEVKGTGIPKPSDKQNTDLIMPARFLKEITFATMGEHVYEDERKEDKDHPFDDPKYAGGSILIAGADYGCGSSREHAPQGLMRYGINGIIAESFAGIFDGNCASIGIVGVTAPKEKISNLVEIVKRNPEIEVEINLENKTLYCSDMYSIPFNISEGVRNSFLNGTWDALEVLAQNEKQIKATEQKIPYLNSK